VVPQSAVTPFSIINWWREHQDKFPELAFLASTLLSAALQTITERRISLKLDTVNSILFLHSNLA